MATKTYYLLSTIPTGNGPGKTPIKQCSAILENSLQCWNASSFLVKTTRDGKPFEYQLCRRHAFIEQQQTESEIPSALTAAEPKPATKVISDSTSTFKPAPAKAPESPLDIQSEIERKTQPVPTVEESQTSEISSESSTKETESTSATKPLLSPKPPKPAAF